jgi:hypothetical protein
MTRNRTIATLVAGFALGVTPLCAQAFSAGTVSSDKPSMTSVHRAPNVGHVEDSNWIWDDSNNGTGPGAGTGTGTGGSPLSSTNISV